jgi:acyl-coenzyme A thioesterase PaaI-like protein
MTTAFLASAREEPFLACARVLKDGRRLVYGEVRCTTEAGRLLTHHTLTYVRTAPPA